MPFIVWKFPGDYSSLDVSGDIALAGEKLVLLSETGSIKWSVDGVTTAKMWGSCVLASDGREVKCLAVEDGSELWSLRVEGVTSIWIGERAYLGTSSGKVYSINKAGKVIWEYDVGSEVKGVRAAGSKIYVLTEEGLLCLDEGQGQVQFQPPPEPERPEELTGEGEWIPGMGGIYG